MRNQSVRRTKEAPEKLKEVIKIVNYLPFNIGLPTIEKLFNEDNEKFLDKLWGVDPVMANVFKSNFHRAFAEYRSEEFNDFWKFVWEDSKPNLFWKANEKSSKLDPISFIEETTKAALKYRRLYRLHDQFELMIGLLEIPLFINLELLEGDPHSEHRKRVMKMIFNKIPIFPEFDLDNDLKVDVSMDEFSQAISGVNIARIRSCVRKKCQKVFYAGRVGENYDPKCCSIKCSKLYFSQQSMEKKSRIGKVERRIKAVQQLKARFVNGQPQWTENAILIISAKKGKPIKKIKLPKGTEVEVTDVDYFYRVNRKSGKEEMPIRFFVELESGEKGSIEIEYSNRFSTNLKKCLDIVD